jgi:hypothetical protein
MNEERVEIAVRKLPRLRIGIWSGRSFVVGVAAGNGNTKREQNESFEHDGLCRRLCASCQIFMKNEATLTSKREGWRIDPRQSLRQFLQLMRTDQALRELQRASPSEPALI